MDQNQPSVEPTSDNFDFRPLEKLELPLVGNLHCEGLIVVVGPNSSGKSQLLRDIYQRLCGEPRELVVATRLDVQRPAEFQEFSRWLQKEGYVEAIFDDNGTEHLVPKRTYGGQGGTAGQIQLSQARDLHNSSNELNAQPFKKRNDFLNHFGRLFVTSLFLENRLQAMNSVGLIDFETQPPQQELHALYLDDEARSKLFSELLESFGKAVWPDTSRGNQLSLRVSDQGVLPTPEERLSPKKMSAFRTIESEGDGLKSYVAICVALLLARRPVCLIDEPEMCLHPPQAHNLGRFIGNHAAGSTNVTLASTHSSQILRGVIQTATNVQIVRLTRSKGEFLAHLVPAEVLAEAVAKPTVRAESVLDGIFAQGVIIIEADSDRLVYQTTWESMAEEFHQDIHFATVGGTGGIADTCKLYRTLKIPVAVVADLDVLVDPSKLKKILENMAGAEVAKALTAKARSIADAIKREPLSISPAEVRDALSKISVVNESWEDESDIVIRRDLNRLAGKVDRMRRLKRGGVEALPVSIATLATTLLEDLATVGVFLVPVGELEEWLQPHGIKVSKQNKWAWANAASQLIQELGRQEGDVWDFMASVGAFLRNPH